jgi:hypothetical protein
MILFEFIEKGTQRDIHYTPPKVARELVGFASDLKPSIIADLSAGRGDLLLEAEKLWPNSDFIATDIDASAIRRLKHNRPSWMIGRCDLRNPESRRACLPLKHALGMVSLLLLNPPFTCRGGTRFNATTTQGTMSASTAMSFMLLALPYLHATGTAISVLPSGCVHTSRDRRAWDYIKTRYSVIILAKCEKGTYEDSAASTIIVRLSPLQSSTATLNLPTATRSKPNFLVKVIRGCCPTYTGAQDLNAPSLVHSTDLRNGIVHVNGRHGFGVHRCVKGPAVLIPRVGLISESKIAILNDGPEIMLSDCVIALKTTSMFVADSVRKLIVENFDTLQANYVGTGAPFITIERLKNALLYMGVCANDD